MVYRQPGKPFNFVKCQRKLRLFALRNRFPEFFVFAHMHSPPRPFAYYTARFPPFQSFDVQRIIFAFL